MHQEYFYSPLSDSVFYQVEITTDTEFYENHRELAFTAARFGKRDFSLHRTPRTYLPLY